MNYELPETQTRLAALENLLDSLGVQISKTAVADENPGHLDRRSSKGIAFLSLTGFTQANDNRFIACFVVGVELFMLYSAHGLVFVPDFFWRSFDDFDNNRSADQCSNWRARVNQHRLPQVLFAEDVDDETPPSCFHPRFDPQNLA